MKGFLSVCLCFLCLQNYLIADIVTDFNSNISYVNNPVVDSSTGTDSYGVGIAFTTGTAQAWRLENLNISLSTNELGGSSFNNYTGGKVNAYLYALDNSGMTPQLTFLNSTTTNSDTTFSVQGQGQVKSFVLDSFSNPNNSVTLQGNTKYFLGLNFKGGTFADTSGDQFLNWDSYKGSDGNPTTGTKGWTPGDTYFSLNSWSDTPTVDQVYSPEAAGAVYIQLDATAVPEVGTWALFLSGVLVVVGGGIWKNKRDAQKAEPIVV